MLPSPWGAIPPQGRGIIRVTALSYSPQVKGKMEGLISGSRFAVPI